MSMISPLRLGQYCCRVVGWLADDDGLRGDELMPVIAAVIEVWLAWKFWWVLVALAGALVLGRVTGSWLARRDDRVAARRRRDAELCARVDRQHAQVLAGDERGGYGGYLAAR